MPDAATPGPPAGGPAPHVRVASGRPLIGRDHELDLLVAAFVAARRGELRRVVLRGPDGSGTRALLAGLRATLRSRRLAHRWATTQGHPGDAAYAALAGLVATGRPPPSGSAVRTEHGTGSSPATRGPTEGDQTAAATGPARPDGLEALLTDLALVPVESRAAVVGERLARTLDPTSELPLVLVVEDLHHMDPLARTALTTTLRALRHTPTLALATTPSDFVWPADVTVPVGPLPGADSRQLAALVAPDDSDRANLLVELSGGLPGLLVALSRWADPRMPAIDQLTGVHPRAPALTLAAGLADAHLADPELCTAANAPDGLVETLAGRGVLRREESAGGGWSASEAWQTAARSALTTADQRQIAGRVADALRRADAPPRLRATVLTAAGAHEAAVSAWRDAAESAGPDADGRATCLLRAVELSPTPDIALVRTAVDALLGVGRAEVADEQLSRALAALPRGSAAARASLLGRQHRALLQLGRFPEAGRALADAAGVLPDQIPGGDADLARAVAEVATLQSMAAVLDEPSTARYRAELACRAAGLIDDPAVLAGAYGALALAQGLTGAGTTSLESFDRALTCAEQCADRALEARIAANRIFVLWRTGQLEAMESSIATELGRLADSGLTEAAGGQLLVGRAVVLHALGRWGDLTDHLERTLAVPERLGAQVQLLLRLQAVELAADLGRIADARAGVAALAEWPGASDPEVAYEVMAVRLGIETLASDAARSEAMTSVAEAAAFAAQLVADPFAAARVRVAALRLLGWGTERPGGPLGTEPLGTEPLATGPLATGPLATGPLGTVPLDTGPPGADTQVGHAMDADPPAAWPSPEASAAHVEGASPTAGEIHPAELTALLAEERAWLTGSGWDVAIDAWERLPMPYRRAWTQLCAAHAAARSGDPEAALELADRSRRTADLLSALPLRAAADRLARQLGRRGSRTRGTLTAREQDVVAQVALGRTNREIARTLGMSDRTVAVHLTRIFAKLGAGTRGEVAHIARRRGLIDP